MVLGLHHVTATADDAQADLDFAADTLGLRLVKKTVNFDNHHVYHFYYGNERGAPGTLWTTFPYKGHGVRMGTKGHGQITSTAFSVPAGSLDAWRDRLRARHVSVQDAAERFGDRVLACVDPSGLGIELVEAARDPRAPWAAGGLTAETAIRGLHSITMTLVHPPATIAFMRDFLGFRVLGEALSRTRLAVGGDGPAHLIDILHAPGAPPAMNGLGTVHHVAMAVATADEQLEIRQALVRAGHHVTNVLDRQYFQSIYFREPGGVLFEIATNGPGFVTDEALEDLGRALKLPPWEETNRREIEAGLPQVVHP